MQALSMPARRWPRKLKRVRIEMKARGAEAHVVSTLTRSPGCTNIRGRDVEYNPVVIAYAVITMKDAFLYVGNGKVSATVARKSPRRSPRNYDDVAEALRDLGARKTRT
ncbi:MAG: aminopeptidase P family N-terminal domain-containing protein [Candidatus Eisenbacteria bacterium]|nr:aminopeptidase P family N-terminal domain-containing protein [Candidatus Eisenbacteria bacterium]